MAKHVYVCVCVSESFAHTIPFPGNSTVRLKTPAKVLPPSPCPPRKCFRKSWLPHAGCTQWWVCVCCAIPVGNWVWRKRLYLRWCFCWRLGRMGRTNGGGGCFAENFAATEQNNVRNVRVLVLRAVPLAPMCPGKFAVLTVLGPWWWWWCWWW